MDRQSVDAPGKLARKSFVDQAMAGKPALPPEGLRHDIDAVMRLPARPMPGMTFMAMRFVEHFEAFRVESRSQLLGDNILGLHGPAYRRNRLRSIAEEWQKSAPALLSSLEDVLGKFT